MITGAICQRTCNEDIVTALTTSLLRWQVFSQWPDALRLVGKALDMQDPPLRHVTLASGSGQAPRQAIKLFQESETVRVFLLPMRAGAAGLTLNRGTCLALSWLHPLLVWTT